MKFLRAVTLTLFLFCLLGWMYIASNAALHPATLSLPLTHLLPFPREDTFGIACFGVSMVSFFMYLLIREEPK